MFVCAHGQTGGCIHRVLSGQARPVLQLQRVCVREFVYACSSSSLIGPNLPFSEAGSSPLHVASWERESISDTLN